MTESKDNSQKEQEQEQAATAAAEANSDSAQETASEVEIVEEVDGSNAELFQQLEEALKLADQNHQKYLTAVADLDNYRKRALKEKDEARKYGVSSLVEDLLPVMDNISFGLMAAENAPEAKAIAEGFQMVVTQLKNTLAQHGIKELDPTGEKFDPNLHDCVSQQADEKVPAEHVIQVSRKGYLLNDRLLRPAMVVVSSGPSEES